jgi:G3E family GTPase
MQQPVPTNLITGALGAGKTTLIDYLLRHHASDQRWAVLVNEFGDVGIDAAALENDSGIAIKEVPGGCICCSAQATLRVALTELLRRAKPDRLLIEPTGIGHPAGIIDVLRDEWLSKALELKATLCLIDPRSFSLERVERSNVLADQLMLSDVVVITKSDLASSDEVDRVKEYANNLYPPKLKVLAIEHGRIDPDVLDLGATGSSGDGLAEQADQPHIHADADTRGWIFDADTVFDRRRLLALFERINDPACSGLSGLMRAKGVFRTGKQWYLINWTQADGMDIRSVAYRRDSRAEVIVEQGAQVDWSRFEQRLRETTREPA